MARELLLIQNKETGGDVTVFGNVEPDLPHALGDMSIFKLRATFRVWARERGYQGEITWQALGQGETDADVLKQSRQLMVSWESHCVTASLNNGLGAKTWVTPIEVARTKKHS